jgi:HEAT repeat protein
MFSLLQRLYDRELSVRIQAICALAQLKNETVVDRLIHVLENPGTITGTELSFERRQRCAACSTRNRTSSKRWLKLWPF